MNKIKNLNIYYPNSENMFISDEKKTNWYIEKGLAKHTLNGRIVLTHSIKGEGFDEKL